MASVASSSSSTAASSSSKGKTLGKHDQQSSGREEQERIVKKMKEQQTAPDQPQEEDGKAQSKKIQSEPTQSTDVHEPGKESEMQTKPRFHAPWHKGTDKLKDKVALITGGDSGIGRAVAVLFAREGATVALNYHPSEQKDAEETKAWIESKEGGRCLLLPGDLMDSKVCSKIVEDTFNEFKRLDILVNNAATQKLCEDFSEISEEQIRTTFQVNIIAMMLITKAALKHLPEKTGAIINTTSVTSFRGSKKLVDYSSTKGAITTFTRSLAEQLAEKGIRVNCVAPGPIWTPLIPASFEQSDRENWGSSVLMGRAGQPDECSPSYLFLASQDSTYFTGQTLHPNGGSVVNA